MPSFKLFLYIDDYLYKIIRQIATILIKCLFCLLFILAMCYLCKLNGKAKNAEG